MIRHRAVRVVAAVFATAGVGVAGMLGAGAAYADAAADQRFTEAVAAMGIQMAPDVDVPGVGRSVCEMITSGRAKTIDPVPTVRGVVSTLQKGGLTKSQAVGLLRASVGTYCPEQTAVIGR